MILEIALGALTVVSGALQQTDTIIPVEGATRLDVENPGGMVVVRTWDRSEIRIRAEHSSRSYVEVARRGKVLQIEGEADRGPATVIDYELTVPRSLDLNIEGMYTEVEIHETDGAVEVQTLEGDILVQGGRGSVKAESVNGEVRVENARGRIDVSSVSRGLRIVNSTGEILAETVSGPILMENVSAPRVEAGTVSGRILYDGTIQDQGRYSFGAHSGRIVLRIPEGTNASVSAASLAGSIQANFPGAPAEFERHRRTTFTLGSGAAVIEMETFTGSIVLERRGTTGGAGG